MSTVERVWDTYFTDRNDNLVPGCSHLANERCVTVRHISRPRASAKGEMRFMRVEAMRARRWRPFVNSPLVHLTQADQARYSRY